MNSNKGDEGVNSSKARRRGRKRFCSQSTATIAANDSCSSTRVGKLTLVKGSFRTPPEPLNSRFTLEVVCPRDPSDKLFSLVPLKSLLGALDVSSGRTRQCLLGSLRSKLEQWDLILWSWEFVASTAAPTDAEIWVHTSFTRIAEVSLPGHDNLLWNTQGKFTRTRIA